ncbi:hypothetical protein [Cereibacter azotoformans]|uniref:hypothetical protein n=1 Tax=Cereibacter azotoformans TaxID=43057 RepID=UPI003B8A95B8
MRDLVRARATAVRVAGKARQHLQGFLLRHGRIYPGKKGWTKAYRRWLTTVRFTHPAQQIVLQDHIHAVTDAEARIERLTRQIADLMPGWSLAPVVEAVQAMRGFGMGLGPVAAPCRTLHRGGGGGGRGRRPCGSDAQDGERTLRPFRCAGLGAERGGKLSCPVTSRPCRGSTLGARHPRDKTTVMR